MPWCEPGANCRKSEKSKFWVITKSRFLLRRFPNLRIGMAKKELVRQRMNVMPKVFQQGRKAKRKILVQLDLYRMCRTAGAGRLRSAPWEYISIEMYIECYTYVARTAIQWHSA